MVREQIAFVKKYRKLIHTGDFYRLKSPFEGNIAAWMVVSQDKKQAIVAYFKILNDVNCEFRRLSLKGLDEELLYEVEQETGGIGEFFGNELINIGLITSDSSSGETNADTACGDFWSKIYVLNAK